MNLNENIHRIKEVMGLNEAKQVGTLYHMTSLSNAYKILNDDILKSSLNTRNIGVDYRYDFTNHIDDWEFNPFGGTTYKKMDELTPFVSFTRDVNVRRMGRDVVFVVDGDMLSNRYKITPYSAFGNKEDGDEREERIDGDVNNFSKYIIKIHIPKNTDTGEDIENEITLGSGKIKLFQRINGEWYEDGVKMKIDTTQKSDYEKLIDFVELHNILYELY